jgi:hypothetical protein
MDKSGFEMKNSKHNIAKFVYQKYLAVKIYIAVNQHFMFIKFIILVSTIH